MPEVPEARQEMLRRWDFMTMVNKRGDTLNVRPNRKAAFTLAEGATHVANFADQRRIAFTLAEVLITLGIIGVVAAMTLPGVIAMHKQKRVETSLAKYYSAMTNAINLSKIENGEISTWQAAPRRNSESTITIYDWFMQYIGPYLKYKLVFQAQSLYQVAYNGVSVRFEDASGMYCAVNAAGDDASIWHKFICIFFPNAKDLENIKGDSAKNKKVLIGRDAFVFVLDGNKGFIAPNSNICNPANIGLRQAPNNGCTGLIMKNGWKIPKDYPIKF